MIYVRFSGIIQARTIALYGGDFAFETKVQAVQKVYG